VNTLAGSQFSVVARVSALGIALSLSSYSPSGFADDGTCKAVFGAMLHQLSIPYHGYTTMALVPGAKPEASEQINTGKAIYVLSGGKWVVSPMTSKEMFDNEQDNIKNSKSACRAVRDESIDGVSATLYSVHEDLDGTVSESQLWISKASGLPVHMKMEGIESRYVYSDVVAPSVH
jgi:hypothetical protein